MGNSGSQTAEVASGGGGGGVQLARQWTHSYPRTPHRLLDPHRVLPEAATPPRLRPTNNGEILYNGGTISGRHHQQSHPPPPSAQQQQQQQTGRTRHTAVNSARADAQTHLKRYGSVPDLRDERATLADTARPRPRSRLTPSPSASPSTSTSPSSRTRAVGGGGRAGAGRKKYRAPPPPPPAAHHIDTSGQDSWEMTSTGETSDGPTRRTRLFKTRAEMKRGQPAAAAAAAAAAAVPAPGRGRAQPSDMRRSMSLPEFQAELQAATNRLRARDHKPEVVDRQPREHQPLPSTTGTVAIPTSAVVPKTFYFGMEQAHVPTNSTSSGDEGAIDRGDVDDYDEDGVDENGVTAGRDGIALHLRPILPKKQLEVPRFSPAAAWRQLAAVDTGEHVTTAMASGEHYDISAHAAVTAEQHIVVCSRERWSQWQQQQQQQQHQQQTADDSGISGDGDRSPSRNHCQQQQREQKQVVGRNVTSWTPQQDLDGEEDSTTDEDLNNNTATHHGKATVAAQFTVRTGHVFSLSLPRDNQLAAYMEYKSRLVTDKQRAAAVTAATAAVASSIAATATNQRRDARQPGSGSGTLEQNDNWFLSRSAPNSLNNGPTSLEHEAGRIMYLPPWRDQPSRGDHHQQQHRRHRKPQQQPPPQRHRQAQLKQARSCENLAATPTRPQDLQDERPTVGAGQQQPAIGRRQQGCGSGRPRRFTFQSTVRQIERRRLAERLSREAERKERQRLGELAAMQRVEEEFQRKRAREKANIRQQLRLYWTDETLANAERPDDECGQMMLAPPHARPEPDGCAENDAGDGSCDGDSGSDGGRTLEPALPPSPPRATQVLSEYRQPQREYKEWQGHGHGAGAPSPPTPVPAGSAATVSTASTATVHPKVVCDMPRATSHQRHEHANNYRRNFAHGVRPHTKCIS